MLISEAASALLRHAQNQHCLWLVFLEDPTVHDPECTP